MNNTLYTSFSNPVRAKLLVEIYTQKKATAKQLAEKYPDIPQASLYRHLKAMLTDGVLKIAEEKPVRGTVEKVYAIAIDAAEDAKKMLETNNGAAYLQTFTQYMLGILQEFKEYVERDSIDIQKDGSGFSVAPIYVTTEELEAAYRKIGEILFSLYQNAPGGGRRLHNLCLITTPPKESI